MKRALLCVAAAILSCGFARGQAQYQVLYNFGSGPNDGRFGIGSLVADGAGNLYGLTSQGGTDNGGVAFELSPNSDGSWSETVLYSFCNKYNTCPSGSSPVGLAVDPTGSLYGTTSNGGNLCPLENIMGCGVVFKLSPPSSPGASWTYTVLYALCPNPIGYSCQDEAFPSGLTLDSSGNLYGTTSSTGGQQDGGAVFELSSSNAGWEETTIYSFCSTGGPYCSDGLQPLVGVTFDTLGNLYGTTAHGGATNSYGGGVVYKLSPGSPWTETVLYSFAPAQGINGHNILGPVGIDPSGNLYTTLAKSSLPNGLSNGAVGELKPDGRLRTFFFDGADGLGPLTGVVVDSHRHVLFGTTGEWPYFAGNVFQVNNLGKETVLHSFCCTDGYNPGGLLEDKLGNLYGITLYGGSQGYGVVFEVIP